MSVIDYVQPAQMHSGVPGLDTVLGGGFTPDRLYLVEGVPGAGKTTLAMQFLLEGVRNGESVLYVTLSETEQELREIGASHGWSLDGVHIHELAPPHDSLDPDSHYTMFHPSEVELGDTTKRILDQVQNLRPRRMVFDSLAELRLLAGSPLRYRRQVLALKQYFVGQQCTVLLLDDVASAEHGLHVHTLVHGTISLSQLNPEYGGDRRRLRVSKFRGRRFVSGYHDYQIHSGGLQVYPRLVAADYRRNLEQGAVSTGSEQLDLLLGDGLHRGTSTLVIGAAGTGKSTLATTCCVAAAKRGERAAFYTFDESVRSLMTRSSGVGLDIQSCIDEGSIVVESIDPAELSPGEFAHRLRDAVERRGVRTVVIDSLNGYLSAMPEERFVLVQLHELLAFLSHHGVVTILISAQQGLIGQMQNAIDVSYLADSVVLLRYFEFDGEVKQAISVLKKRTGGHEHTIRPMAITPRGIEIGEPLRQFRGVLTGVPYDRAEGPADSASR
ncbi:ATPase domain-containing protein [Cognatilysobacter lacus]|uniref:non-specific serine/threonine protein kinase n=1 Tax=Cognatilysobacter lacus TaxID=1643323 RepID=A0A5D8Z5E1_9GAMM|nr:ATPase domain-containing protein [Lysobacter lacus]TZF89860.1 AAA family ATPase [Lysobacter lacus]